MSSTQNTNRSLQVLYRLCKFFPMLDIRIHISRFKTIVSMQPRSVNPLRSPCQMARSSRALLGPPLHTTSPRALGEQSWPSHTLTHTHIHTHTHSHTHTYTHTLSLSFSLHLCLFLHPSASLSFFLSLSDTVRLFPFP